MDQCRLRGQIVRPSQRAIHVPQVTQTGKLACLRGVSPLDLTNDAKCACDQKWTHLRPIVGTNRPKVVVAERDRRGVYKSRHVCTNGHTDASLTARASLLRACAPTCAPHRINSPSVRCHCLRGHALGADLSKLELTKLF